MVDKIRRAFDEMEAPICPTCQVDMQWSRSTLVERDTINHVFFCVNCHRTGRTTSKIQVIFVPPDKMSAPYRWKRVA